MPQVIVIGAGLAGLGAATELQRQGIPVKILEARNEIGGRTRSPNSLGMPLDIGASWLHGSDDHPLRKLAEQLQLDLAATDYDNSKLYLANGALASGDRQHNKFIRAVWQALAEAEPELSVEQASAPVTQRFANKIPQHIQQQLLSSIFEEEFAASRSHLSVGAVSEGLELNGDDLLIKQGYSAIVQNLAQGLDIATSQRVVSIDYSETPVTINTNSDSFAAQQVILTVPLGVLKAGSIEFQPSLPSAKQAAINSLGSGDLNKLYLKFPHVFWDQKLDLINYADESAGRWLAWYDFSELTGEPVLLGFNAAEQARAIESLSDQQLVAEAMQVLRTIYGPQIPSPSGVIVTRWHSDPLARGAYSYLAVGAAPEMREQLAAPLAKRLYFAGEATSSNFPATTQGAYLSGIREAQRIIDQH